MVILPPPAEIILAGFEDGLMGVIPQKQMRSLFLQVGLYPSVTNQGPIPAKRT